jgi:uncharacterized protein with PIN domain
MRKFREAALGLRFERRTIIRLGRLLHMEYKPSELADELDIHVDMIYRNYIPAGCPHRRDEKNLIWIVGTEFAAWARTVNEISKKKPFVLQEDEAWCVHCNKVVRIDKVKRRAVKRNLDILQGTCPECGGKINRLMSAKK